MGALALKQKPEPLMPGLPKVVACQFVGDRAATLDEIHFIELNLQDHVQV